MKRPSFYWLLGLGLWLSAAAWAQQDDGAAEQKYDVPSRSGAGASAKATAGAPQGPPKEPLYASIRG